MNTRKAEISVGLFLIIGIAALAMLALKVSNISETGSSETYQVIAKFDNIGSLKVRSPVRMGGVLVGRVSNIHLDSEYLSPVVTLSIFKLYNNLPSETSAAILTAGLLGEQYLSLSPGGDEDFLTDGDEIEDTQSALVIEELIGQFLFNDSSDDI
ncbi:MAG: phospholipid/cholesterol/gamma-HCH transport system substrate-binding protein [Enterobacterales bacterium]|jgi:phospholipid/cholesterol/gamma-HCH transport system substrate-binding protein